MSNRSEIGNRDIIKRIESEIGVVGQGGVPSHLSGNDLQGVIVFGNKTAQYEGTSLSTSANYSLAGASNWAQYPIGTITLSAIPLIAPNVQFEYRLTAMQIQVNYDAAGAIADNTKKLELDLSINGSVLQSFNPWVTVATGVLNYKYALSGFANGVNDAKGISSCFPFIPYVDLSGQSCSIALNRTGGGTFPANTGLFLSLNIIRAPKGLLPPV